MSTLATSTTLLFGKYATVQAALASGPPCGLPAANNLPSSFYASALTACQNSGPPSGVSPADRWTAEAQTCLIVRGLVYWKTNPGDCPAPTELSLGDAQATQLAGSVASGIAAMAGATLPGIGLAVAAITTIFENHAKAVATEQETICGVIGVINQVIPYYDGQVKAGKISPSNAYSGMQAYIAQVTGQLQSIAKTSGDAANWYAAFLLAHANFCKTYYPAIAPAQVVAVAPGSAPVTVSSSPTAAQSPTTSGGSTMTSLGAYIGKVVASNSTGTAYFVNSDGSLSVIGTPAQASALLQQTGQGVYIMVTEQQIAATPGWNVSTGQAPYGYPAGPIVANVSSKLSTTTIIILAIAALAGLFILSEAL
jgi:hypothetical protein